MKSRRDFLKIAAGAGMAWPLAGCNGAKPKEPATAAPAAATPTAAGKTLHVITRGAFAYGTIDTRLPKLLDHEGKESAFYACPPGLLTLGGISATQRVFAGFKADSDETKVARPTTSTK